MLMGSQNRGLNPSIPAGQFVVISLVSTGDVQANQITDDRTFTNRGWHGDIAEILIYTKALSDDEEAKVGRYLAGKYGLNTEYPPEGEHRVPSGVGRLRAAIRDLMATFGREYPDGAKFSARLDDLEKTFKFQDESKQAIARQELEKLQREALVANPLVSGQPLLFVARNQYANDHHNTETMFQTGEINTASFRGPGALKVVDLKPMLADKAAQPKVTTLVDVPQGIARDPTVSFDGTKVLFSMRHDREDDYHLYEVNADGTSLKQLTFGQGISDIDPIYLPDGRILFTSTREPKYCMCNRHIMGNLFTMDADGANIQQIGHSTLHEGHASLLPDGRVIYDRWEYVDRNFGNAQGLWTTNPDGTNHVVYYGNSTESPGAKLEARVIPGTEQVICTFSSCHDRPWGALAILDRRLGVDGRPPVVRTWPASAMELVDHGGFDTFSGVRPKYQNPYPLSAKYFLCSRMTGDGEQMGIYLLDLFGNEILLHAEGPGCYNPRPLAARVRPPVIPSRVDLSKTEGYFYVSNVYEGTGMDKIKPGTIKQLRVVESPEKRFWTGPGWDGGTGQQAPGMAWNDFNNKAIVGTAPVEADGSAYFAVPADTFVYFQLLDEKGMMVQSMRSGTIVRPGEQAGCVGCHEYRLGTAVPKPASLAMRRGPSKLDALVRPAAELQLPRRGPAGVRPAMRIVPRLRQGGGQEAQPGRGHQLVLQHLLRGTPQEKLCPGRGGGAGRRASAPDLGIERQPPG